jgi:hypothetical protein
VLAAELVGYPDNRTLGGADVTARTKQIISVIIAVILVVLAINFIRDRGAAKRAFREGFDSTAGSPARTP